MSTATLIADIPDDPFYWRWLIADAFRKLIEKKL